MLIVGELINTTRQVIKLAAKERNAVFIQDIARKQVEAGAHYLDVNCGTMIGDESEVMGWLVQTIQKAVTSPLCIDTPDSQAMEAGLKLIKNAQPMINSITAEKERFKTILPLVLKYKAKIVALCMDDKGLPETAEERIRIVHWLVENLTAAGVSKNNIYLDPLVKPVSTKDCAGLDVLETVRFISSKYPEVHIICGLSNVSFGLPHRKILNQVFTVQTMTAGMDAYILNPLNKVMMGFIYASQTLLGKDPFCTQYLKAYREGFYK